jgi:putative photosynthetic complex assembly protein
MASRHPNLASPGDRPLRWLALALLCLLLTVGGMRLAGYQPEAPTPGPIVASRDLLVQDLGAGSVQVRDYTSGRPLLHLAPGEGSFIRGVLRGLARERRSHELGAQIPFRLSRHSDGHLRLTDPATGTQIDLQAFGTRNEAAFAPLLGSELVQR